MNKDSMPLKKEPSISDDGLSALQLDFLPTDDLSEVWSSSKDWILGPSEDLTIFDEIESPVDFFGHYSNHIATTPGSFFPGAAASSSTTSSLHLLAAGNSTAPSVSGSISYTNTESNGVTDNFSDGFNGLESLSSYEPISTSRASIGTVPSPFSSSSSSKRPFRQDQAKHSTNNNHDMDIINGQPTSILSPQQQSKWSPLAQIQIEGQNPYQQLHQYQQNINYQQRLQFIQNSKLLLQQTSNLSSIPDFSPSLSRLGSYSAASSMTLNGRNVRLGEIANASGDGFNNDQSINIFTSESTQVAPSNLETKSDPNSNPNLNKDGETASSFKLDDTTRLASSNDSSSSTNLIFGNMSFLRDPSTADASQVLSFRPATAETVLYDSRGNRTCIDLAASLSGNFFLSRNPGLPTSPTSPVISNSNEHPTISSNSNNDAHNLSSYELTFYRRNLFQVTATIANAHTASYAANTANPMLRSRILSLSLAVTVSGSDDTKPIKLLYCPPKAILVPDRKEQEPAVKPIYPKNSGYDEVVDWKRLQFRSATAHNGRKKLQNYFAICVSLYAELENAQRVCLVKTHSRPIVVRGRNPRFYQNRDNITLPGGSSVTRTISHTSYQDAGASNNDVIKGSNTFAVQDNQNASGSAKAHLSTDQPVPNSSYQLYSTSYPLSDEDNSDEAETKSSHSFEVSGRPLSDSIDLPRKKPNTSVGIERETQVNEASSDSKDMDYEYFPIPLNYWLPPVEVVYRPHAVHHPMNFSHNNRPVSSADNRNFFTAVDG